MERLLESAYLLYDNDMNCTWTLKAEQGYYVNFVIETPKVRTESHLAKL